MGGCLRLPEPGTSSCSAILSEVPRTFSGKPGRECQGEKPSEEGKLAHDCVASHDEEQTGYNARSEAVLRGRNAKGRFFLNKHPTRSDLQAWLGQPPKSSSEFMSPQQFVPSPRNDKNERLEHFADLHNLI